LNVKEVIASGILEMYVLGIASTQEIQLVEDCIANYPEETLAEIQAIEEALATHASAYATEPPAHLQQQIEAKLFGNVLEKVSVTETNSHTAIHTIEEPSIILPKKETPIVALKSRYKFVAAAAAALLLGSVITNIWLYSKYNKSTTEIAAIQNKMKAQQETLVLTQNQIDIVSNKYAQSVALNGVPKFSDHVAKVYWIKNTNDVYVDPTNLPEAPKGKQYQFWAIIDGKPVDGGMIQKNSTIKIEKMKSFSNVQAFAITLEKEGGNTTPTMEEMRVMGTL
jgi:anti-sigma-K factor RskA